MNENPVETMLHSLHDDIAEAERDGYTARTRMRGWLRMVESVAAAIKRDAALPVGDREADRQRFPDADFNRWLDDSISDCGHTVWDAVGDVQAAWAGWDARGSYAAPLAAIPEGWMLVPEDIHPDDEIVDCSGIRSALHQRPNFRAGFDDDFSRLACWWERITSKAPQPPAAPLAAEGEARAGTLGSLVVELEAAEPSSALGSLHAAGFKAGCGYAAYRLGLILASGLSPSEVREAVGEITARIEACGASPELTRASSLASDLWSALEGREPYVQMVREQIATPPKPEQPAQRGEEWKREFKEGFGSAFTCLTPIPSVPAEDVEAAFKVAMRGKHYGTEETRDAFAWFKAGYTAANEETPK